jgi:hypothetical protein
VTRGLRTGDGIIIEVQPSRSPGRLVTARVLARDGEQILAVVTPGDLAGLTMEALEGERHVVASWSNGFERAVGSFRLRDMAQHPVGIVRLDGAEPLPHRDRRRPRLHRTMPAHVWTPEIGDVMATVVDLSLGGARLKLRDLVIATECQASIGEGAERVDIRAVVIEVVVASVTGTGAEIRVRFVDPTKEALDILRHVIFSGVDHALSDLRQPLVEARELG